jgi:hypothetical protein
VFTGLAVLDAACSEQHRESDPDRADVTHAWGPPKVIDRLAQCEA